MKKRRDASNIRRLGVLDGWRRKASCAIVFNIDDVGRGEVFGEEGEFLLNASWHEDGGGLSMNGGEQLVTRVALNLRLKVGN